MSTIGSLALVAAEAQAKTDSRFSNVFTLYLLFNEKAALSLERRGDRFPRLMRSLTEARNRYPGFEKTDMAEYVVALDSFDELRKTYTSYRRLVVEAKVLDKRRHREEILIAMKEKGLSKYRIYSWLKINPGNANDFLKNGRLDRLSLKTVEQMLDFCRRFAPGV